MDLQELDRNLERLRAATDRAGANLLELDQAPARGLLAVAQIEGQSAPRWAEAERALASLFQSYAALCTVIDAAVAARGAGRTLSAAGRAKLAHLVLGPSVETPERAVPLAERELISESRTVERCTPDELLASMAAPFAVARSVIMAAAEAWEVGGAQVKALRERLATVAASGGLDPTAPGVAMLDRRLDELAQLLMTDPLAYDPAAAADLGRLLDELAAAVDGARRAQADHEDDMAEAAATLASLREAAASAEQAQGEAEARLTGLGPLPPLPLAELGVELDHIAALGADGAWPSVAAELADWRLRTEQHRRDLDRAAAAQRDALDRRRQLRGRLDAYTAKAAHLGYIEHPHLAQLRSQAEALLFCAPTDLAQAEDAVRQYQQALDAAVAGRSEWAR